MTIRQLFRYWFTFADGVTPRQYLTHGAALMAVKYASCSNFRWQQSLNRAV